MPFVMIAAIDKQSIATDVVPTAGFPSSGQTAGFSTDAKELPS
jgi:hypothetical protein